MLYPLNLMTNNSKMAIDAKKKTISGNSMGVVCALCIALVGVISWLGYEDRAEFLEYMAQHQVATEKTLTRLEAGRDAVTSLRMEQCHDVQEQSIDTLRRVTDVMAAYTGQQASRDNMILQMTHTLRSIELQLSNISSRIPIAYNKKEII
jgi:hypothetical protein